MISMKTNFKLDCAICQVAHLMYDPVTLIKPSHTDQTIILPIGDLDIELAVSICIPC